jgi:hypothetical protein
MTNKAPLLGHLVYLNSTHLLTTTVVCTILIVITMAIFQVKEMSWDMVQEPRTIEVHPR